MPRARLAFLVSAVVLAAGCGHEQASPEQATTTDQPAAAPQEPATAPTGAESAAPPTATPPPPAAPPPAISPASAAELEAVVRAWSAALNADDNVAAAALFAPAAIIAQSGVVFQLATPEEARRWNETLPCSGTIVELVVRDAVVGAVFELGDRPSSRCDAPAGTLAAALFQIEGGLITAWQQVAPEAIAQLRGGPGSPPTAPSA